MSSQQKLKFCANLSMMYAKEAPSLLDRYTLAKSFGFKGVECAFPYEFSKEDLIKVHNKFEIRGHTLIRLAKKGT